VTALKSKEGPSLEGLPRRSRRRVRVLFVNDTARNGGPGRSLHSILKFLDPAVVHRAVVLPRSGAIGDLLAQDGAADEIHLEPNLIENPIEPWARAMQREDFDAAAPLKLLRFMGNVVRAGRAIARLSALIDRGQFDLVYCNGTNADFAGGALAALTGCPALWHVRYTSLPKPILPVHRHLAASRGVRRIVCVSRAAAALFPHCAGKVSVIHNALDVGSFDPAGVRGTLRADLELPAGAIVFGSHGRVLRRKGYIEMIHAARMALDRMSEGERASIFFVVIGDTPQDFRPDHVEECRRLATRLGLADRFRMMGFRADVRPLVVEFDVAVVPSVYPDPLPRSVIESMALGKPVIAYDVGGVVEMVEDGVTGNLVRFAPSGVGSEAADAGSIERLAQAFIRYARDRELRARQGLAARERILRDFDARAHGRRIQDEILNVVGEAATGRGRGRG
jgi:glycosyltransferase involved in cell wall biosynthesis